MAVVMADDLACTARTIGRQAGMAVWAKGNLIRVKNCDPLAKGKARRGSVRTRGRPATGKSGSHLFSCGGCDRGPGHRGAPSSVETSPVSTSKVASPASHFS